LFSLSPISCQLAEAPFIESPKSQSIHRQNTISSSATKTTTPNLQTSAPPHGARFFSTFNSQQSDPKLSPLSPAIQYPFNINTLNFTNPDDADMS